MAKKYETFIAEAKIKLGGTSTPSNVDQFFDELTSVTKQHPFNNKARILGNTAVELYYANGSVHLSDIQSFNIGSGAGTEAMEYLVSLADKHRVTLDLFAVGYASVPTKKLIAWYKKFGFVVDDGKDYMVRKPK